MGRQAFKGDKMRGRLKSGPGRKAQGGFSLVELLVGIFLMAVALLGLAHFFLMGVMNNNRSSEITNAFFLAQQQIDYLRTLTSTELDAFPNTGIGESNDETLDINADGTLDFRRLTVVNGLDQDYEVSVYVFPAAQMTTARDELLADPDTHKVRARLSTKIGR